MHKRKESRYFSSNYTVPVLLLSGTFGAL